MTFGEKLQDLRRKAGMSQDMLAEKLEVSRQAVSKWERDEAMPETEKVVRIAKLFGVSLDELLLDREPKPRYEQPPVQPSAYAEVKRTAKRHGYKLGYALLVLGVLTCVGSLVMYFAWPAIGGGFFDSAQDSFFSSAGMMDVQIAGGELSSEAEAALRQELGGAYGYGGLMDQALSQMDGMTSSALKAQAGMFLVALLPGVFLTAAGAVIIVKGKKLAKASEE